MGDKRQSGPILVGVDGSATSHTALRWAHQLAVSSGHKLIVVHAKRGVQPHYVVARTPVWPWPMLKEDIQLDVAESTVDVRDSVLADLGGDADFDVVIDVGPAADNLLNEASRQSASLLVLGTHGRSSFASLVLGSVSDHCAGHASCPVAVVGEDAQGGDGPVVVGFDGSDHSTSALRWAAEFALARHRGLLVVTVWQLAPVRSAAIMWADYQAEAHTRAESAASMVALEYPGLAVSTMVRNGNPGHSLAEAAAEVDACALVVGSRGLSGIASMFLGSTSRTALHHHNRNPVVVV